MNWKITDHCENTKEIHIEIWVSLFFVILSVGQKQGDYMKNRFICAEEVAQELSVSKPYAYKLIRQLNEELKEKGFITISGRVNRQYFYERLYGAGKEDE